MLEKITQFITRAQAYSKAIVAAVGGLLTTLASLEAQLGLNIIPAEAQPWITFALAVLTAFSVWAVPNIPASKPPFQEGEGLFE
jgi:hypothetical protein